MSQRYYPHEICLACGKRYGKPRHSQEIGMWNGKCGWCVTEGPVCSPRDFLFPEFHGAPPADWGKECKCPP